MSLDVFLSIEVDTGGSEPYILELYESNITHNLIPMAKECHLYLPLWRPEELNISKAGDLIEHLFKGLQLLLSDEEKFKQYDSKNGWGTYKDLVNFTANYLKACRRHPKAEVNVWR